MKTDTREAREKEIEIAAYRLLEEKGFAATGMQAIARAAKASNETLYRWYGDKTGLYRALISRNADLVRSALAESRTGGETGLAVLARTGPVLLSMLLGPRAIALNRAAAADPTGNLGQALAESGRNSVAPWIVEVMAEAVAAGEIADPGPDTGPETDATLPKRATEIWLALLIGDLQIRRLTGAIPALSSEAIDSRNRTALEMLCRCLPPQG